MGHGEVFQSTAPISFQLGPHQQPAATASHMSEPRRRSGTDMVPEDHSLQRDLTAPKSESETVQLRLVKSLDCDR